MSNHTSHRRPGYATVKVALNREIAACPALKALVEARSMSAQDFIAQHASGTLRNAAGLPGNVVTSLHYLEERTAFVFGYGWRCLNPADVHIGDAISEGDVSPVTDAFEWSRRYIDFNPFPEDEFEVKFLQIKDEHGIDVWEGIGLVCRQSSAQFFAGDKLICCPIAQFDKKAGKYLPAQNPF